MHKANNINQNINTQLKVGVLMKGHGNSNSTISTIKDNNY